MRCEQDILFFSRNGLVSTPVVSALVEMKWRHYGRRGLAIQMCIYVVFLTLWTAITLSAFEGERLLYRQQPWRIAVDSTGVLILLYFVVIEFLEIFRALRRHRAWRTQRIRDIEDELQSVNPTWEDARYFRNLRASVEETSMLSVYLSDAWNYLDWLCYLLLIGAIISQVYGVIAHNSSPNVTPCAQLWGKFCLRCLTCFIGTSG
jgi:hypothetical protein